MKSKKKNNILLIFANPSNTSPLQLDAEFRTIQQSLERSIYRDNLHIFPRLAATIRDLRRALLEQTFQVIHIAGHGSKNGLILANEQGGQYVIHPPILAELFQRYSSIECVLLNCCYSTIQSRDLASFVPFTIAMEGPITDEAAIAFSCGFYDALGAGHSIETAYQEGIIAIKTEVSPFESLPKLIKKGEVPLVREEAIEVAERTYVKTGKYLVGFAVDLSGSMNESIRNQSDESISRLKSLNKSFDELMANFRQSLEESKARNIEASIDIFVYGFGIRTIPVCDLLALVKASSEVITEEIIRNYKENFKKENEEKYKGYRGTSDVIKSLGLGDILSIGEGIVKRLGRDIIIKRILRDMSPIIENKIKDLGDVTLPFEELSILWNKSEINLQDVREVIFGNTPIKEVFATIEKRFGREIEKRGKETQSLLFLVSDGKFADADPLPLARALQSMGVNIISCFISDQDIANPRVLLNTPDPEWGPEARLMFELSSTMGDLPEMRRYLLQHNWVIYPKPKLFVQLNHSDVLNEFVRLVLSMFEDSDAAHVLPRGW